MSIFSNSRYVGSPITKITLPSGENRVYLGPHISQSMGIHAGYSSEIFSSSDSLDNLSAQYLGSETFWWVIADTNGLLFPEVDPVEDSGPNGLFIGRNLIIPPRQ